MDAADKEWCVTPSLFGFAIGEHVCVHGEGFGDIVDLIDRDVNPYAVVAIPRRDTHEPTGREFRWTERVNVSLDVYPAHMSRSAR